MSVNGCTVEKLSYADVVRLIQMTPDNLQLVVVPKQDDILQTVSPNFCQVVLWHAEPDAKLVSNVFSCLFSNSGLIWQQMALLGFSNYLMPRRDQRDAMSLVIRTHVSIVAPDWDL